MNTYATLQPQQHDSSSSRVVVSKETRQQTTLLGGYSMTGGVSGGQGGPYLLDDGADGQDVAVMRHGHLKNDTCHTWPHERLSTTAATASQRHKQAAAGLTAWPNWFRDPAATPTPCGHDWSVSHANKPQQLHPRHCGVARSLTVRGGELGDLCGGGPGGATRALEHVHGP